jgi:hypothetical protein
MVMNKAQVLRDDLRRLPDNWAIITALTITRRRLVLYVFIFVRRPIN